MMAITSRGQYPFSDDVISWAEWQQHQSDLAITCEIMEKEASRLKWNVERPPKYPSVQLVYRHRMVTWSFSVSLGSGAVGQANAAYCMGLGVEVRVPLVFTRRVWYVPWETATAEQLRNRTFVEGLVRTAVASLQSQIGPIR